jgi:hypothetical protein
MSNKKFSTGSFLSSNAWSNSAGLVSGSWTGQLADSNAGMCNGTTTIDPQWHSGGFVPPDYKPNAAFNIPVRYVEIHCLFCNARFSTPILQQRCWGIICVSCMKSFRLHMETCDPECDQRVDCLLIGIISHVKLQPIINVQGIRQPEVNSGQWIVNPNSTIKWDYNLVTDLYVLKCENQYYEACSVQDNRFKGDPFQLPDVSKR